MCKMNDDLNMNKIIRSTSVAIFIWESGDIYIVGSRGASQLGGSLLGNH